MSDYFDRIERQLVDRVRAVTVVRRGDQVTLRGVTPATRSTVQAVGPSSRLGGDARPSRVEPLYYLFGSPGSRGCAAVAG